MGKVQLISLGCSKNRVDSEHLLRQIADAGWDISPEGEDLSTAGVDTVIVNTCGFIGDAKEESVNVILEAAAAKKEGKIGKLLVFGCLAQRYAKELPELLPEVDGFFGVNDQRSILSAMGIAENPLLRQRRLLTTPKHYGYLKISEGCDRRCSYCAIPLIRGPHVSVPMELLEDEARSMAASGVKELILIAQDTTWYGIDLYGKRMLAALLKRLSVIDGIEWIRIHYSYPDAFPDDVLEAMASDAKICNYIDIPLQHCANRVLAAMRRSIDGMQTREVIRRIRASVPGVALRTTLMVGHPGEGPEEFEQLLDFIREFRFERMGAFQYSEEEGTWGAQHLKDDVPPALKQERWDRLMEAQSAISQECNIARVGRIEKVLVDSCSDGVLVARSQYESPEVDGEILIGSDDVSKVGQFVNVKITNAGEYDLLAELI